MEIYDSVNVAGAPRTNSKHLIFIPAIEKIPRPQLNITFTDITDNEIIEHSKITPTGKAPGPNGVQYMIIKRIAQNKPAILCNLFILFFRDFFFLIKWKTAKLILFKKEISH